MKLGSVDWLWLGIGVLVGLIVHRACTHPMSPVSNYIGTNPNQF